MEADRTQERFAIYLTKRLAKHFIWKEARDA